MTTTITTTTTPRAHGTVASPRNITRSAPTPSRLTVAQEVELEGELRRELAALERRLASELLAAESAAGDDAVSTPHDVEAAARRGSDNAARRDEVAAALARLTSRDYGTCARCGEPIAYGRLVVMPEAAHCLACSVRSA